MIYRYKVILENMQKKTLKADKSGKSNAATGNTDTITINPDKPGAWYYG